MKGKAIGLVATLHTQSNRKLFDVMTKGSGDARMQPLYFLITTAGTDTHSTCCEIHQDPAGNVKADKEKDRRCMALDRAIRCGNDNGASVYDERGILSL